MTGWSWLDWYPTLRTLQRHHGQGRPARGGDRVDASCTAGPDPDLHAKGLDVMEALQITVLNR